MQLAYRSKPDNGQVRPAAKYLGGIYMQIARARAEVSKRIDAMGKYLYVLGNFWRTCQHMTWKRATFWAMVISSGTSGMVAYVLTTNEMNTLDIKIMLTART